MTGEEIEGILKVYVTSFLDHLCNLFLNVFNWIDYLESVLFKSKIYFAQCFTSPTSVVHQTGVNFMNILFKAFMCKNPKSAKRQSSFQCHFALLGSLRIKAACEMLVKSTPGNPMILELKSLKWDSFLLLINTKFIVLYRS